MNELADYLEGLSAQEREAFAERCGTSFPYLRQIAAGLRQPKAQLAVLISKESRGRVSCEALLPELDWRYLRRSRARNGKAKERVTA